MLKFSIVSKLVSLLDFKWLCSNIRNLNNTYTNQQLFKINNICSLILPQKSRLMLPTFKINIGIWEQTNMSALKQLARKQTGSHRPPFMSRNDVRLCKQPTIVVKIFLTVGATLLKYALLVHYQCISEGKRFNKKFGYRCDWDIFCISFYFKLYFGCW